MPRAQDKAIAIRPTCIMRVVAQVFHPKRISHRRRAHRQARVSTIRLLNRIHRKGTDGINRKVGKICHRVAPNS